MGSRWHALAVGLIILRLLCGLSSPTTVASGASVRGLAWLGHREAAGVTLRTTAERPPLPVRPRGATGRRLTVPSTHPRLCRALTTVCPVSSLSAPESALPAAYAAGQTPATLRWAPAPLRA